MPERELYGILGEFETPEALVAAARSARRAGYRALDTFTPFPIPELYRVLRLRDHRVLWFGLCGGVLGFALALAMQMFTNFDYPINVGGRPLYALSAFAVVAFELTVLFAALAAALGMLALNGLPRLHHPVFDAARFHRASRDRFFLCILAADKNFERSAGTAFLRRAGALSVAMVES